MAGGDRFGRRVPQNSLRDLWLDRLEEGPDYCRAGGTAVGTGNAKFCGARFPEGLNEADHRAHLPDRYRPRRGGQ
jgi:hypothetical protein